jgi:hypothetical protein
VISVSEHALATPADSDAAGGAVSSPDFDRREIDLFGKEDGAAITVIGKMLVAFFFYSFIVMSVVALWTMARGGQGSGPPAKVSHGEELDE